MRKKTERVYVKVSSDFDKTGYMQPRAIIMDDGRRYVIDQVSDYRPFSSDRDCYTIIIRGQQRFLFFERSDPLFRSIVGRWYMEI